MPHILIVEDEAVIAGTLVYALQGEGFTTTWLTLALAAMEHQRDTPADLIILDVGLPDIRGFETCKQLRRFTEVPVMFLSARWRNRSSRRAGDRRSRLGDQAVQSAAFCQQYRKRKRCCRCPNISGLVWRI